MLKRRTHEEMQEDLARLEQEKEEKDEQRKQDASSRLREILDKSLIKDPEIAIGPRNVNMAGESVLIGMEKRIKDVLDSHRPSLSPEQVLKSIVFLDLVCKETGFPADFVKEILEEISD